MKKENLKRKSLYETAEVEITLIEKCDVITTSGETGDNEKPGDQSNWGDWT